MSMLFNAVVIHECCPDGFLLRTLNPIPKSSHKSANDCDNYRGIALISIMGKVLDLVILKGKADIVQTSENLFGFKKGSTTTGARRLIVWNM